MASRRGRPHAFLLVLDVTDYAKIQALAIYDDVFSILDKELA